MTIVGKGKYDVDYDAPTEDSSENPKGAEVPGENGNITAVSLRQINIQDENGDPLHPQQHDNPVFHMENGNSNMNGGSHLVANGYSVPVNGTVDTTPHMDTLSPDSSNMNSAQFRRRHRSEGQTPMKSPIGEGDGDVLPLGQSTKSNMTSLTSFSKFDDSFIDENGFTLMYSRHEKMALKDFSNEIRAARDVESYLKNMVLLLNLNQTSLDDIIEACLNKMLESVDLQRAYDQAKSALFTHDNVHHLSRIMQGTSLSTGGGFDYDQNWICAMCAVPALSTRRVCIARLLHPANLGQTSEEVNFLIVILVPTKEKGTKNEMEVARTFGTIFSDIYFRQELLDAPNEEAFKEIFSKYTHELAERHLKAEVKLEMTGEETPRVKCGFMKGVIGDLKRRLPHYWSDYKDGVADKKSIAKTISCTFFLYFACILPSIAFGVLNESNTEGILTVEKVIYSQVFGGMVFAILGGTPQIVLLTTAPLALYTQIIFSLSDQFDLDFQAFFACVGLFNCLFLVIFAVFDLSILMQFSTRSSEEIFALFISIAFSVDAFKNCAKNFDHHYCEAPAHDMMSAINSSMNGTETIVKNECAREISLLYLLLLLGTLWLGVTLFTFKNTPYLTAGKRELLADYALPVSVIIMAFVGAFLFRHVDMSKSFEPSDDIDFFTFVDLSSLPWGAVLGACGLGFCLSLLFFMDQNISAALVNAPQNKMKKGTAYHWDLLVIAAINGVLSMLCFPWVHAALPHSPLHVLALADVEERVDQGHIHQIVVRVRETRLTNILSHVLIGLSLLILSVLAYIPTPVLYGLFLYVAVTALFGNQMFERVQLFFTEQSAYPPNHYIRRVPQRKMHIFTGLQLLQLLVLCGVGFAPYPYLKMFFPVLIFLLIPIRHKLIPKVVDQKYLKAMDGH